MELRWITIEIVHTCQYLSILVRYTFLARVLSRCIALLRLGGFANERVSHSTILLALNRELVRTTCHLLTSLLVRCSYWLHVLHAIILKHDYGPSCCSRASLLQSLICVSKLQLHELVIGSVSYTLGGVAMRFRPSRGSLLYSLLIFEGRVLI